MALYTGSGLAHDMGFARVPPSPKPSSQRSYSPSHDGRYDESRPASARHSRPRRSTKERIIVPGEGGAPVSSSTSHHGVDDLTASARALLDGGAQIDLNVLLHRGAKPHGVKKMTQAERAEARARLLSPHKASESRRRATASAVAQQRAENAASDMANCTGKPVINERSRVLAAQRQARIAAQEAEEERVRMELEGLGAGRGYGTHDNTTGWDSPPIHGGQTRTGQRSSASPHPRTGSRSRSAGIAQPPATAVPGGYAQPSSPSSSSMRNMSRSASPVPTSGSAGDGSGSAGRAPSPTAYLRSRTGMAGGGPSPKGPKAPGSAAKRTGGSPRARSADVTTRERRGGGNGRSPRFSEDPEVDAALRVREELRTQPHGGGGSGGVRLGPGLGPDARPGERLTSHSYAGRAARTGTPPPSTKSRKSALPAAARGGSRGGGGGGGGGSSAPPPPTMPPPTGTARLPPSQGGEDYHSPHRSGGVDEEDSQLRADEELSTPKTSARSPSSRSVSRHWATGSASASPLQREAQHRSGSAGPGQPPPPSSMPPSSSSSSSFGVDLGHGGNDNDGVDRVFGAEADDAAVRVAASLTGEARRIALQAVQGNLEDSIDLVDAKRERYKVSVQKAWAEARAEASAVRTRLKSRVKAGRLSDTAAASEFGRRELELRKKVVAKERRANALVAKALCAAYEAYNRGRCAIDEEAASPPESVEVAAGPEAVEAVRLAGEGPPDAAVCRAIIAAVRDAGVPVAIDTYPDTPSPNAAAAAAESDEVTSPVPLVRRLTEADIASITGTAAFKPLSIDQADLDQESSSSPPQADDVHASPPLTAQQQAPIVNASTAATGGGGTDEEDEEDGLLSLAALAESPQRAPSSPTAQDEDATTITGEPLETAGVPATLPRQPQQRSSNPGESSTPAPTTIDSAPVSQPSNTANDSAASGDNLSATVTEKRAAAAERIAELRASVAEAEAEAVKAKAQATAAAEHARAEAAVASAKAEAEARERLEREVQAGRAERERLEERVRDAVEAAERAAQEKLMEAEAVSSGAEEAARRSVEAARADLAAAERDKESLIRRSRASALMQRGVAAMAKQRLTAAVRDAERQGRSDRERLSEELASEKRRLAREVEAGRLRAEDAELKAAAVEERMRARVEDERRWREEEVARLRHEAEREREAADERVAKEKVLAEQRVKEAEAQAIREAEERVAKVQQEATRRSEAAEGLMRAARVTGRWQKAAAIGRGQEWRHRAEAAEEALRGASAEATSLRTQLQTETERREQDASLAAAMLEEERARAESDAESLRERHRQEHATDEARHQREMGELAERAAEKQLAEYRTLMERYLQVQSEKSDAIAASSLATRELEDLRSAVQAEREAAAGAGLAVQAVRDDASEAAAASPADAVSASSGEPEVPDALSLTGARYAEVLRGFAKEIAQLRRATAVAGRDKAELGAKLIEAKAAVATAVRQRDSLRNERSKWELTLAEQGAELETVLANVRASKARLVQGLNGLASEKQSLQEERTVLHQREGLVLAYYSHLGLPLPVPLFSDSQASLLAPSQSQPAGADGHQPLETFAGDGSGASGSGQAYFGVQQVAAPAHNAPLKPGMTASMGDAPA